MSYVATVRMFVRVYELGSMSAAARDQRVSAAVASARIAELEKHLGVRLFNRTTRSLQPTEHGQVFYKGAVKILETIEEAEAAVADISRRPRGSIHVAAPLGIGKRLIAPLVPTFKDRYPGDRRAAAALRPQGRHPRRGARRRLQCSGCSRIRR
jgi:DNA-binding transcriptional LysR family regulator